MLLAATSSPGATHLGVFVIVVIFGFVVGVAGHLTNSRTLILTGIILIAGITAFFAATGEIQTFGR